MRRTLRLLGAPALVAALLVSTGATSQAETPDVSWTGQLQYERHTDQSVDAFCSSGSGTLRMKLDEQWTIAIDDTTVTGPVAVDATITGSATVVSTKTCNGVELERRTMQAAGTGAFQLSLDPETAEQDVFAASSFLYGGRGGLPGTLTAFGTTEAVGYYPDLAFRAVLQDGELDGTVSATVGLDDDSQATFLVDGGYGYDWGTEPIRAVLNREQAPSCPAVMPTVPAVTSKADAKVGSRTVHFRLVDSAPIGTGISYTLGFGDGKAVTITRGQKVSHTYATAGLKRVQLVMIYLGHCVSKPRSFDAVADPVTTYAPALHLHRSEKYFPDSVDRFLANATLVHDRPNLKGRLTSTKCRDSVIAAGPDVSLSRFADARGNTRLPKKTPTLHRSKLGKSGSAYAFTEYKIKDGRCVKTSTRSKAYGSGAKKLGSIKSKDDGLVLSLAGRPASVLTGDASLGRAKSYVVFKPGRYITYWFWYPYNGWKSQALGSVFTERHEGDWEHVTVSLASHDGQIGSVAYYQHYCKAKIYPATGLDLESGTHPPVWAAKGGHASYQKNVGVKVLGSCWAKGPNGPTDTTSSGGKVLRLWQKTSASGSRLVDATTQPWYGFKGAWGDPRKAFLANYGPQAPGGQSGGLPSGW